MMANRLPRVSRSVLASVLGYQTSPGRLISKARLRLFSSIDTSSIGSVRSRRIEQLVDDRELSSYYPRLQHVNSAPTVTPREFHQKYKQLQQLDREGILAVFGRVKSARFLGPKLVFIDVERQDGVVQCLLHVKEIARNIGESPEHQPEAVASAIFEKFKKVVRKGDWISVTGHPTRTKTNELSILATEVPQYLAPSLHIIPKSLEDAETMARYPHINSLVNQESREILQLRSHIKREVQNYFFEAGFIDVETPMFDVRASGALARPFETRSNDLSDVQLRLRIAPELQLKRLIVAGHEKIFEIGRVFRNEGIDSSHNPEFTICEFYEVGATLDSLMKRTENLFRRLHRLVHGLNEQGITSIEAPAIDFAQDFQRLEFIPTIERHINRCIPNLNSPHAEEDMKALFRDLQIPLPDPPALSQMLETLGEKYIEPLCTRPTFVMYHPSAISPLAKSFEDPNTGQLVAARCEMFIEGREYVNAYEEENEPRAQYQKFKTQLEDQESMGNLSSIDESYVEVLEWGMPPTGGWGCGMDRLVMLFTGASRIADVLPLGTLKNVLSLSRNELEKDQNGKVHY